MTFLVCCLIRLLKYWFDHLCFILSSCYTLTFGEIIWRSVGRLVHIDFGFILETSPGGNMRFESAHFKLSHEMTQLLDPSGVMKSETWNQFLRYWEHFCLDHKLLCFLSIVVLEFFSSSFVVYTVSVWRGSWLPAVIWMGLSPPCC